MPLFKCKTCGGNILINTETSTGICDSCGENTEIDLETIKKYKSIYDSADRMMRLRSSKGYSDAIDILKGIPFVDGAEEKIKECNDKLAEMKAAEIRRKKSAAKNEENDSKVGTAIFVITIIVALLLLAGIVFFAYHLLKGDLSQNTLIAGIAITVIIILLGIVGKLKN